MLKLSRKQDYAVLAITHLAARESGSLVSARALAEETHVPPAILANILKDLTRLGVVRSTRGIHGGYELAMAPEELTVGQLVRSLDGPSRLVECVEIPGENSMPCQLASCCTTKIPLRRLHEKIHAMLDQVTFRELVSDIGVPLSSHP